MIKNINNYNRYHLLIVILLLSFAISSSFNLLSAAVINKSEIFLTLKSQSVNMRTGPSIDHPILQFYKCKHRPMLLLDSFREWRKVQDEDGVYGWIHRAMLTQIQYVKIRYNTSIDNIHYSMLNKDHIAVLRLPSLNARPIGIVTVNAIGKIKKCQKGWCNVLFEQNDKKICGWVPEGILWGVTKEVQ